MAQRASASGKKRYGAEAVAFGRVIAAARAKSGISQEELAFRSETNRTYVSELERGVKEPCLRMILKIAKALATTSSALLQDIEDSL